MTRPVHHDGWKQHLIRFRWAETCLLSSKMRVLVSTFLPSHWPPWFRRRTGSDTFQQERERGGGIERQRENGEREGERKKEGREGEKESALAGRGSGQNRSCLPGRWCFPYWLSGSEIWALGPRKSSHVAPLPILRVFHLTVYHVARKADATSARTLRKLLFLLISLKMSSSDPK